MSPQPLPAELVDIILDHLHDDRQTLASCAVVRRSWLPASLYHFWSTLRLECTPKGLDRLHELSISSPNIACHIRNIVFSQSKNNMFQVHDISLIHSIIHALTDFPALKSLTLDGLILGSRRTSAPPDEQLTLTSVKRLVVTDCTFADFTDIPYLWNSFPGLSTFHLEEVWWGSCTPTPVVVRTPMRSTASLPALTEFTLGDCFSRSHVMQWMLACAPVTALKTLRLPVVGIYDIHLPELLAAAGTSLSHLDIGSPTGSQQAACNYGMLNADDPSQLEPYLDLSHNTALRTLTLGVPTFRDLRFGAPFYAAIIAKVASPVFEEVRFALHDTAQTQSCLSRIAWDQIAKVLSQTAVRRVTYVLGASCSRDPGAGAQVLRRALEQTVFPRFLPLTDRGVEVGVKCV